MASPLEGMGFSVANKMVDSVFNEHSANKAFSRQKALMQMQNAFAVENWNRENAYNTPQRQKERLIAAGLNPDMLYGQSGVASMADGIAAPTAPSSPMATMGVTDTAGAAQSLASIGLAGAQAKKLGADTIGQELQNEFLEKSMDARLTEIALKNKWTRKQAEQIDKAMLVMDKQMEQMTAQIGLTDAQSATEGERKNNLVKQNELLQKQIDNFTKMSNAQIAKLYADARKTNKESDYMYLYAFGQELKNQLSEQEIAQMKSMLPLLLAGKASENLGVDLTNYAQNLKNMLDTDWANAERQAGLLTKGLMILLRMMKN